MRGLTAAQQAKVRSDVERAARCLGRACEALAASRSPRDHRERWAAANDLRARTAKLVDDLTGYDPGDEGDG